MADDPRHQPTVGRWWWARRLRGWLRVAELTEPRGTEEFRAWGVRIGSRFVGVLKVDRGSI